MAAGSAAEVADRDGYRPVLTGLAATMQTPLEAMYVSRSSFNVEAELQLTGLPKALQGDIMLLLSVSLLHVYTCLCTLRPSWGRSSPPGGESPSNVDLVKSGENNDRTQSRSPSPPPTSSPYFII